MKTIVISTAAAAMALIGMTATFAPAMADPGNGEGAIVFNDLTVFFRVPRETGGFHPGVFTCERHTTSTPSGVFTAHCRGEFPVELAPSRNLIQTFENINCAPGRTGDATVTYTPQGTVRAKCTSNPGTSG